MGLTNSVSFAEVARDAGATLAQEVDNGLFGPNSHCHAVTPVEVSGYALLNKAFLEKDLNTRTYKMLGDPYIGSLLDSYRLPANKPQQVWSANPIDIIPGSYIPGGYTDDINMKEMGKGMRQLFIVYLVNLKTDEVEEHCVLAESQTVAQMEVARTLDESAEVADFDFIIRPLGAVRPKIKE